MKIIDRILKCICGAKNTTPLLENKYKEDFGLYADVWKNHRENYKRIIRVTKDYIVYIDKNNNIDWETTDQYDNAKLNENSKTHEKLLSQCSIVEHKPFYGLSEASIISFKIIIGESLVNCLENNYQCSTEILVEADKFRVERIIEKSREWYLIYTVILAALFIFSTLAINAFNIIGSIEILQILNSGAWAIAGACLSIILRSGRLRGASYAGKRLHFIESGCRLISGFVSGQIAYLGMKSGIIFTSLITTENSQYIYTLLVLLAGSSERFAPSIISKIENSSSINDNTNGNAI
jgi:hypothetical protein